MRVLIYKDEVLDALQTCLDTDVIPYDKGKNYIRYEQAVYEINKLQDKSELFGSSEQLVRIDMQIDCPMSQTKCDENCVYYNKLLLKCPMKVKWNGCEQE